MTPPTSIAAETSRKLLHGELPLQALTPEAGARRYFRPLAEEARGWLLVRSPDPAPIATTDWLTEIGIRVPHLGPQTEGAYLVEDCGDRHLEHDPSSKHYRTLLSLSRRLSAAALGEGHPNRRFALDRELFLTELKFFREWYVQAFRRRAFSPREADEIDAACEAIATEAALGPTAVQHRDLHCRNILLAAKGELVLIDHQDLRPGPCFYDLASLATDAYVDLSDEIVRLLHDEIPKLGQAHGLGPEQSLAHFRATALQRVLKALGTFGRLLVRGRLDYRSAEARARKHALSLLEELAPVHSEIRKWLSA